MMPHNAFEDHLIKFSKYALLMCILVIPSSVSDPEDIPEMNDISENFSKSSADFDGDSMIYVSSKTVAAYEEILVGISQDMYDLGYI